MAARNKQTVVLIDGEQYYSAQKAEEKLDMTYSGLRYQVIAGNIKAEIPKGRKQAYYRAKDVEQLSRELKIYTIQRREKPTKFTRVTTREEMAECQEIYESLFGTGAETLDYRMATIAKNPDTYFIVKDENQIVGFTAIIPLKPGKLEHVLKTIPTLIAIEDIADFGKNKEIDLYFRIIGVKRGFSKAEKRFYGSRLIAGLIGVIVELGKRGVTINTIAARSSMPEGIRLMKGIGFTEIETPAPERKYRTFVIDTEQSGIPFIVEYKEALHNAKQPGLDSVIDSKDSKQHETTRDNHRQKHKAKALATPAEQGIAQSSKPLV